jgi:hypothetical protein
MYNAEDEPLPKDIFEPAGGRIQAWTSTFLFSPSKCLQKKPRFVKIFNRYFYVF